RSINTFRIPAPPRVSFARDTPGAQAPFGSDEGRTGEKSDRVSSAPGGRARSHPSGRAVNRGCVRSAFSYRTHVGSRLLDRQRAGRPKGRREPPSRYDASLRSDSAVREKRRVYRWTRGRQFLLPGKHFTGPGTRWHPPLTLLPGREKRGLTPARRGRIIE